MMVYELFVKTGDELRLAGVFSSKDTLAAVAPNVIKGEVYEPMNRSDLCKLVDELLEEDHVNVKHGTSLFILLAEVDKAYDMFDQVIEPEVDNGSTDAQGA